MTEEWSPASWRTKKALQQPAYKCEADVTRVMDEIAKLPPLVTSWEIIALRQQLSEAASGERFLLQGGDCAESFDQCNSPTIANKLKILLQMSLALAYGSHRRVIRVGRFAGQYAKPRSDDFETIGGATLPSYRGDLINRPAFTESSRTPDPELMLRGYERARGPLFAALASSLLFGLAHGVPAQIAAILPIAWVLARAAQHSGSFWTGVLVHALNNFGSLLLAVLLSGSQIMARAQKELENMKALPLGLGLAGLLVAAACMFVATLWLRPRTDIPAPVGGSVVSGSLVVLLVLIAVVIAGQVFPLGALLGR